MLCYHWCKYKKRRWKNVSVTAPVQKLYEWPSCLEYLNKICRFVITIHKWKILFQRLKLLTVKDNIFEIIFHYLCSANDSSVNKPLTTSPSLDATLLKSPQSPEETSISTRLGYIRTSIKFNQERFHPFRDVTTFVPVGRYICSTVIISL